ncbi:glycosyltransferase family 2 protein [Kiritimatiellota bacterium B12222]|nr:glycosyltransferase family 2 protein [Kiritimatiellota bacterium B12222]
MLRAKDKTSSFQGFESPELDEFACQNYLVIIPALNEAGHIGPLVTALREMKLNVLVVDDGSEDATSELAEAAGAVVIRNTQNYGKGKSLAQGYQYAAAEGYDALVTMDADGQHDPADVPRFFDTYERTGIPVLVGNRMHDRARMPLIRRWTNRLMSRLLNRQMNQYIPDTQNGFRLYQTDVVTMVIPDTAGFAAESEILLKLDEIDIRMGSVPIAAIYGDETSHIRPIYDTRLFFKMLFKQFSRK